MTIRIMSWPPPGRPPRPSLCLHIAKGAPCPPPRLPVARSAPRPPPGLAISLRPSEVEVKTVKLPLEDNVEWLGERKKREEEKERQRCEK